MARNLIYENLLAGVQGAGAAGAVDGLDGLSVQAKSAQFVEWRGSRAIQVEDGLVILPCLNLESGSIEVEIGVEQSAYPGVAFRIADPLNFELAYGQPHTSGSWDALQYDPVFHGSNTWQIHFGPRFQKEASVPTGSWYLLKLDFAGDRAALSANGQLPLVVDGLAHRHRSGMVGLWTFRRAYFRNLRVYSCRPEDVPVGLHSSPTFGGTVSGTPAPSPAPSVTTSPAPTSSPDAITDWFLEGYGVIKAEPHGLVLLNRYLPSGVAQATLTRKFRVDQDTRVEFKYGFTDVLSLAVDGITIFSGSNTFSGFGDRDARGYAEPDAHSMAWNVKAGVHIITAVLSMNEPFGWGFGLSARGDGLRLLPPWMA